MGLDADCRSCLCEIAKQEGCNNFASGKAKWDRMRETWLKSKNRNWNKSGNMNRNTENICCRCEAVKWGAAFFRGAGCFAVARAVFFTKGTKIC